MTYEFLILKSSQKDEMKERKVKLSKHFVDTEIQLYARHSHVSEHNHLEKDPEKCFRDRPFLLQVVRNNRI